MENTDFLGIDQLKGLDDFLSGMGKQDQVEPEPEPESPYAPQVADAIERAKKMALKMGVNPHLLEQQAVPSSVSSEPQAPQ